MANSDPKTVVLDHQSDTDDADRKALTFDVNMALRDELRPAKLKQLLRRDPLAPLYDDKREQAIAERVVAWLLRSNWFFTRKPSSPKHTAPDSYENTPQPSE